MHGLLDDVMVGLVLLASCIYALVSLGPRSVKRRLSSLAAAGLKLAPKIPGLSRAALRLEAAAAAAAGSCGGCDNCGSQPAPVGSSAAPSATASSAPEISIPVSKIGRRGP